jgi:hypothetical protein
MSLTSSIESEARALRQALETGDYDVDEVVEAMVNFYNDPSSVIPRDRPRLENGLKSCLERFPRDCCDIASVLLMNKLGEGDFTAGVFYTAPRIFKNHAFLLLGEVICDITADQFRGGPKLYVGDLVLPWSIKPYSWDIGAPYDLSEQWQSPHDLF